MAKRKISDTLRSLNAKYGSRLNYQRFFLAVVDGRVPAERDATGRFWLINEDDEPHIAHTLNLIPAEPDANSSLPPAADTTAKSEPASNPAPPRASTRRSAA